MNRSLQIKFLLVAVVVLWSLWSLYPTLRMAQGLPDDISADDRAKVEQDAISLGLDLKGGIYMAIELKEEELGDESLDDAMERTIEILRMRIDTMGLTEPVIQREGNRIVVQLPGVSDIDQARKLIGTTARLEFRMVQGEDQVTPLIARLDQALSGKLTSEAANDSGDASLEDERAAGGEDAEDTEVASTDSTGSDIDDLLASGTDDPADPVDNARPFSSLTGSYYEPVGGIPVSEANVAQLKEMLESTPAQRVIPNDAELLWGTETLTGQDGKPARILYLVETQIRVRGDEISSAVVTADPQRAPALMVSLNLTRKGGVKFANVTGANVGRKLGIVLDKQVKSAPNILGRIPGGRASISGGFEDDMEARNLALLLRTGALPVGIRIEEERTISASLGQDSIDKGVQSVLIGGAVVIVFMIIYYKVAGLLATFGLMITLIMLMGILARFGLTLTLPGIAGIILTVGMAVDANVLIFERIREEMRAGKSVRASIDAGFSQATRAIVDANITTFIAAIVLFYFGTGPIKGFAVTLSVGILTSMFAALVFTRSVYEAWLGNRAPKSLSI